MRIAIAFFSIAALVGPGWGAPAAPDKPALARPPESAPAKAAVAKGRVASIDVSAGRLTLETKGGVLAFSLPASVKVVRGRKRLKKGLAALKPGKRVRVSYDAGSLAVRKIRFPVRKAGRPKPRLRPRKR